MLPMGDISDDLWADFSAGIPPALVNLKHDSQKDQKVKAKKVRGEPEQAKVLREPLKASFNYVNDRSPQHYDN